MIPFDFEYYAPRTAEEAVDLYKKLSGKKLCPVYFAGGTELITRARVGNMKFDSVIDIKGIAGSSDIAITDKELIIGANAVLTKITESRAFPLLGDVVKRIADHTNQNKITIGGNIIGSIIYKESILPLLLSDAIVEIWDNKGKKAQNINQLFNKKLNLNNGELITSFRIPLSFLKLPYFHKKVVKYEKIDYPLITIAAINIKGKLKCAVSGLYEYPCIIQDNIDTEKLIGICDDIRGSASFRKKILIGLINEARAATKL